jgi:hypothetical protein
MGMYTQLMLNVEIYPDYVEEVEAYVANVPRLRCVSHYFNGDHGYNEIRRDNIARCLRNPFVEPKRENTEPMAWLHVSISCKNYEQEIQKFLAFLSGKVVNGGGNAIEHVGHMRYENDVMPKLIFFHAIDNTLRIVEAQYIISEEKPSTTSSLGSATKSPKSPQESDSTHSAAELSHSIVRDATTTSSFESNTCTDM